MKPLLALAVCAVVAPLSACNDTSETDDGRTKVAVAFYPIEEIVRRVGGGDINVGTLVKPGDEPHEFEPTARQLASLEAADVVFYLGSDFQPSLQKAIEALPDSVRTVDLLEGPALRTIDEGVDPHVWLDPRNMESMTQVVADVLSNELPEQSSTFVHNAATYINELGALHDEFTAGLADCAVPVLITTHEAFGYLAQTYGLTELAIAGVSPGDEPSAKELEAIAALAAENGVTTVFFEENLPAALSETLANEIGASVSSLASAESLTSDQLDAGASYISLMRDNLAALRMGMRCE